MNGRPGELLCASHPDHAGQLVVVAGGEGLSDEAGPRCRSFRLRREPVEMDTEGADDTVRYINLAGGLFAIVDAADYESLSKHYWRAIGTSTGYYACCKIGGRLVFMHRLIMNPPEGFVVDHINANKQDNRRCNLRVCTQAENVRNKRKGRGTSRFKGVSWDSTNRKWVAKISHQGKTSVLGRFDDEIEAARAYDRAARERFGAFAYLNFPQWGNIVRLSGRIWARSHASGRLRVCKSEIRILDSRLRGNDTPAHAGVETNSNITCQRSKLQIEDQKDHRQRRFRSSDLRILTLDIACDFAFRIWPLSRGPPERRKDHALKALD